jgi:hypothetical protein
LTNTKQMVMFKLLYKLIAKIDPSLFCYPGLMGCVPKNWPTGYVVYPDGDRSMTMAIGNAFEYKDMFGGEVIWN